jgi:hypothetical protein
MKSREQKTKEPSEEGSRTTECRADHIFYARTQTTEVSSVEVLGDYACDFRRPDWAHRWADWNSGQNRYLNLFLCSKHARELGLKK